MSTIIIIFISEIIVLGLILYCIIRCNLVVNQFNKKVIAQNKKLKNMIPTLRSVFTLTHEYIELWKKETLQKIEASGNIVGELVVYYLMHKVFKKQYEKFEMGFSFAKLFW